MSVVVAAPAPAAPAPAASPAARHSAAGVSRSSSTPHKEPSRWAPGVRGRDDDGAGYSRTPQWVAAAAAASTAGNRGDNERMSWVLVRQNGAAI